MMGDQAPTAVWLRVGGEGDQQLASAVMGVPKPTVDVTHLVFMRGLAGKTLHDARMIQVAVNEAVACVPFPLYASLYAVQDDAEAAALPEAAVVREVRMDPDRELWYWVDGQGKGLGGYAALEKAIINALLSVGWVAELLRAK
ncbi:MAG: hypothetical protein ACYSVY_00175 [Planctomycetota bacterium]